MIYARVFNEALIESRMGGRGPGWFGRNVTTTPEKYDLLLTFANP